MNSSVIDTVNDLSDIQYDYNVPIAKPWRDKRWVSQTSIGLFTSTNDLYNTYKENVNDTSQVTLDQFYKDIQQIILECGCKVRRSKGRGYMGITVKSNLNW